MGDGNNGPVSEENSKNICQQILEDSLSRNSDIIEELLKPE